MNFKLNWQYGLLLALAVILPLVMIVPFYIADRNSLVDEIYQKYQTYLALEIERKIESKHRSSLVLATALSSLPTVRNIIENTESLKELPFAHITEALAQNTNYKNLWIQPLMPRVPVC